MDDAVVNVTPEGTAGGCRILACAALLALLGACAVPGPRTCPAGQDAMVSESVYFGTARPGGVVSGEQWQGFLREVVTPRFPAGFSVLAASGQWMSAEGTLVQEQSHVLNVVHRDSVPERAALDEIARSYATRFQQEAVLRVRAAVCVSF